ncbi:hypothetical protein PENSPDRAFT_755690 [Peniophora sp. CONT]|nr:hypothetical protein PENSPDRAFT_755690 [Peniophora sp. CONT]
MSTPELEEHLGGSKHDSRIVPLALSAEINNRSDFGGQIFSNEVGAHKIRAKQSAEVTNTQPLEEQNNYYIRVFFRDAFRSDGSPLNRSVRMLCGARLLADGSLNGGATPLEWCGNLLVMRCMKRDGEERYLSATRADIEVVREWLGLYQGTMRGREKPAVL